MILAIWLKYSLIKAEVVKPNKGISLQCNLEDNNKEETFTQSG